MKTKCPFRRGSVNSDNARFLSFTCVHSWKNIVCLFRITYFGCITFLTFDELRIKSYSVRGISTNGHTKKYSKKWSPTGKKKRYFLVSLYVLGAHSIDSFLFFNKIQSNDLNTGEATTSSQWIIGCFRVWIWCENTRKNITTNSIVQIVNWLT